MLIGTWSPQHHGDLNHLRGDGAPDCSACNEIPAAPNCWGPAGYFWEAWLQDFSGHMPFPRHMPGLGRLPSVRLNTASSVPAAPHGCCHIDNVATCPITAFGTPERADVGRRAQSII